MLISFTPDESRWEQEEVKRGVCVCAHVRVYLVMSE